MVPDRIETAGDLAAGAAVLLRLEPRFGPVLRAVGALPLRRRADGFGALVAAIVGQQVSTASAAAILGRVEAAGFGDPARVRAASDDALRACGLSRPKVRYVRALAEAGLDYRALRAAPVDEVLTTLIAVPGIGRWTAEIYAKFALGHVDVFAAGDLALQEAARRLFGLEARPSEREMRQLAAAWSPVRAVAARALWAYYRLETDREGILMTRVLDYGRRPAASGEADSMVIFLHGYGADGGDLLGLAEPLAPHLPDTVFVAPDAPERSAMNPMGFQWFPIPWLDGSSQEEADAGMARAVDDLNAFIDRMMIDEDMLAEQVALVGFSQGTMISLHIAPRRDEAFAGVVGFSGRLLRPEALVDEVIVRPPVLLIHGDQDDVVPPQSLPEAAEALEEAGWKEVYAHIMKGTAHGIAPDGLSVALAFLRERFGVS